MLTKPPVPSQQSGGGINDSPSQSVGLGLVTVLDQLRVQRVVALGDGAGGSIIARYSTLQYSTVQYSILIRFGMCHPARVHGVILINTSASSGASALKDDIKVHFNLHFLAYAFELFKL